MVPTALAYIGGLSAGMSFAPPYWLALAVLAFTLIYGTIRLIRSRRIDGPLPGPGVWLWIALFALGAIQGARMEHGDRAARAEMREVARDPELMVIEGRLAEEPSDRGERIELRLTDVQFISTRVGSEPRLLPMDAIISVREAAAVGLRARSEGLPLPGQPVRLWGRLWSVENQTNPTTFDGPRYSRSLGIGARIAVVDASALQLDETPKGILPALRLAMRSLRDAMTSNLEARLPTRLAALGRSLLIGEARRLDDAMRDDFRISGLAHLLAVSGTNTGIVLILIIAVVRLCGLGPRRCAVIGMIGVVAYAALTGFQPPVVRATLMVLFVLTGFAIGRMATSLASLALAAFVTLLIDPRNLLRVDWQLSYACVQV